MVNFWGAVEIASAKTNYTLVAEDLKRRVMRGSLGATLWGATVSGAKVGGLQARANKFGPEQPIWDRTMHLLGLQSTIEHPSTCPLFRDSQNNVFALFHRVSWRIMFTLQVSGISQHEKCMRKNNNLLHPNKKNR